MKKLWWLLLTVSLFASAASVHAEKGTMVRYIGLDFQDHSGTLYNEKLEAFPPEGEDFTGRTLWILGLRVNVMRQASDGTLEDETDDPRYTRVLHQSILAYTGKPAIDGVADQRPIGLGAEITDFDFPPPYAYKISDGRLYNLRTHAHNMGGLPDDEQVFAKLTFLYDDDPDAPYTDTNVLWIDVYPDGSEFCVARGERTYSGYRYQLQESIKPVLAVPHIHDHSTSLELKVNGISVMQFAGELGPVPSYHNSHSRCQSTGWHDHFEGGHLMPKTLNTWTLSEGLGAGDLGFRGGDLVWAECSYSNPHEEIPGMGILMVFYAEP